LILTSEKGRSCASLRSRHSCILHIKRRPLLTSRSSLPVPAHPCAHGISESLHVGLRVLRTALQAPRVDMICRASSLSRKQRGASRLRRAFRAHRPYLDVGSAGIAGEFSCLCAHAEKSHRRSAAQKGVLVPVEGWSWCHIFLMGSAPINSIN